MPSAEKQDAFHQNERFMASDCSREKKNLDVSFPNEVTSHFSGDAP
jgi:hypothetical protein